MQARGIFLTVLSAVLYGMNPLFSKTINVGGCNSLTQTFARLAAGIVIFFGSTPILVDKGQKGRGTASCNLPATRYIIEANPLNVLKPRAFRFAACIMELIPSQTAFVMRW